MEIEKINTKILDKEQLKVGVVYRCVLSNKNVLLKDVYKNDLDKDNTYVLSLFDEKYSDYKSINTQNPALIPINFL